ncbi:zinc finger CCHC domain-containing protein 8-like [Rhopilema esculentum]|uniref:zinc finger CCHC domain-containing protein 8-like n=1 Tax=Rhopilema esculentum TaxID=499914 RepID=UPI0031DB7001
MEGSIMDENFLFGNFEEQPTVRNKSKKSRKRKLSDCIVGDDGLPTMELPEELSKLMEQKDRYINQLEEQNNKLKAVIKRLCGPQNFLEKGNLWERGSTATMPMAVVLLLNNEMSFALKKDVEESMLNILFSNNGNMEGKLALTQDLKTQQSAIPLRAFTVSSKGKRLHIAKNASKDAVEPHIYSAVHYYFDFCIDRTGLPLLEHNPGITEVWAIPVYDQVFFNALPVIDDDGKKVFVRQRRSKYCFNCLGDHNVNQCDQPKDMARINTNRQDFVSKFGGSPSNDSRYHDGEQERFKSFKAGIISENLREALCIGKDELPPYIYKMRTLGYPPGYVKSTSTGLLMYGKEGQIQDSYDGEEGEIQGQNVTHEVQYPGFNSPMEEGVIDRSIDYGMPPFEEWRFFEHNRSHAGNSPMQPLQAPSQDNFKRTSNNANRGTGLDDMEIEDTHGHLEDKKIMCSSPMNGVGNSSSITPHKVNDTSEKPHLQTNSSLYPPPLPPYTPEKAPPPPSHGPNESANESAFTAIEIGEILEEAEMRARQTKVLDSYLEQGQSAQAEGSSHRQWWNKEPLSDTAGILYFTCTPPPSLRIELSLSEVFKFCAKDLDREPWKTDSTSWYDPLYGDLSAPTGIYDSIKEILKRKKKRGRKKC